MKLFPAHSYQAELQLRFAAVERKLGQSFPGTQIEHIGASSIPGAVSKGDLDICLLVAPERLEACVVALQAQGYQEKQETLRSEALCMLEWLEPAQAHAVQVVAQGSKFVELFIGFRDRLRASPALVEAYNQLKTEWAVQGEDAYRAAKSKFIEAVLAAPT
ncbi:hypothetical protein DBR47_10655 [Paucibacter sp. KBW04]|uniref:GrpB family protein n=1 Tax=Paucibacter sp. KBW04 TaxID=2153361 RepID=UPI000F57B50D|nr:GrpB family protein [Paucibacter sp. KBW04]RQO59824.1 hypothetical protein DBR47_10655 [Paucibacter sp. KBW04]